MRCLVWLATVVCFGFGVAANLAVQKSAVNFKPLSVSEHFGPFKSWLDVKRDFGAKGDGISDDTDALQRALDAIRWENSKASVVFIPAGTYRITRTLQLVRKVHAESQHIIVIGEHPEKTVIRWDGGPDGVMVARQRLVCFNPQAHL